MFPDFAVDRLLMRDVRCPREGALGIPPPAPLLHAMNVVRPYPMVGGGTNLWEKLWGDRHTSAPNKC